MNFEGFVFLAPALVMSFVLVGIHCYLGLHVLARNVLFIDLALAQVAALGGTVAVICGHEYSSTVAFFFSLAAAVVAAFLFTIASRFKNRISLEAFVGIVYAFSSGVAVLLVEKMSHGADHLKHLLVGQILWTSWADVIKVALIYSCVGFFHFVFRAQFYKSSFERQSSSWHWDFLFYLTFSLVITCSVNVSGVLLVFVFLIVPAVLSSMWVQNFRARLWLGWGIGFLLSTIGILSAIWLDSPPGPTIISIYTLMPIVAVVALALRRVLRI